MTSSPSLEPGEALPDTDHALRYVARKYVDLGAQIEGDAFLSRPREKDDGSSVNWLEFFAGDVTQ